MAYNKVKWTEIQPTKQKREKNKKQKTKQNKRKRKFPLFVVLHKDGTNVAFIKSFFFF